MDIYEILFRIAQRLLPYRWYVLFSMALLITALSFSIRNIIYIGKIKKALRIYIRKNSGYLRR